MQKTVSIIIPCREIDEYTLECVKQCLKIDYPHFEILLISDAKDAKKEKILVKSKRLKLIYSGKVKPAIKRNLGMKKAKGTIYAFIDSDAYPAKEWLKNATKYLEQEGIGMVGGPNLTPTKDNFRQKISGILLSKWFVGGRTTIRYKSAREQETVELPSCNFIVKKEYATDFEQDLLTAEDSKFCFNITNKGKKILYAPDVVVYHHRRGVFMPHARQMWVYGRDIALLLKRKEQFSLGRLYYSMLSIFVLGVVFGGLISLFSPIIRILYLWAISVYLAIVFISSLSSNLKETPYLFYGIILTHLAYGLGFLYGLTAKNESALNKR